MSNKNVKDSVEVAAKSAQEQLDSLKTQLEQLLHDRINPALLEAADRADHAVANARELRDYQVHNVETRVRARPLAAILISAVVGFIAGRISK
ncbi:hypothetical protein [Kozakia baliensis]|uniref:Uncharacterized protein n=1 Tax=Kozakia baliensis TaxID=153496 RepID=A0A1D8UV79_9PROT|nr:hypothetical protein [Kozakia baliensis]AOX17528.1 hypothetical protein A0U89_10665 [Kozakia baliensis]AOX20410.1 hypothetical protein A0U90_08965 [Kozakia baliensis]GBR30864.1 hypothetical protein AA0488_2116 [Kozakia baliensis NRIC 0488]GEL63001.1 hypothetical protein KBA01_02870 [Kozakia baliensis]